MWCRTWCDGGRSGAKAPASLKRPLAPAGSHTRTAGRSGAKAPASLKPFLLGELLGHLLGGRSGAKAPASLKLQHLIGPWRRRFGRSGAKAPASLKPASAGLAHAGAKRRAMVLAAIRTAFARNLTAALPVDRDSDDGGDRNGMPAPAHLQVSGIEPEIGPLTFAGAGSGSWRRRSSPWPSPARRPSRSSALGCRPPG